MIEPQKATAPLRFVILCDSYQFEQWQAECIRETLGSGRASIAGVVMRQPPERRTSQGKWRKRWKSRKLAFWRIYDRFYLLRFSKAILREDLSDLLHGVPAVKDHPVKTGKFGEALSEEAMAFLEDVKPDFILRFSYGILRGNVLNVAKYGVWSFHHGDPARFRGQPPGFWEIRHRAPVTGAILQVLSDELDAGRILHRGFFQTLPQSYAKSRDLLYMGVASWVKRACADIQLNGWPPAPPGGVEKFGPIYRQPKNLDVLAFLWVTFLAFLRTQWTYKFHRQTWNCAVIEAPPALVAGLEGAQRQKKALERAVWMNPARTQFFADPFGIPGPGPNQMRILFERFDWSSNRGDIASAVFDGEGFGVVEDTLSLETHLSYPFVFEQDDEAYLLPENAEDGDVLAYVMSEGEPAQGRPIVEGAGWIDTTVIEHEETFWAFAVHEDQASNTHLHLYFADDFEGPWRPHPLNPVKSDVSSARPAGTPFRHGGKLYRPAQDCATHYGSAVTVNEVTVLSRTDYRERAVSSIQPQPNSQYPYGLHTLSVAGPYTLIDGARKERRF